MCCVKITFDVRGISKCQHVPWAARARGSPCSAPFGSCWAAVHPAWGETDGWQLPTQGDLPVPCFVLSLLLVECVTEPVQLAKQAKRNLTAVCCCDNWVWKAPARAGTKKREGARNGATSLVGVSCYSCSCIKLKSVEETLLYKETQNSSVLGFGTASFSEATMQD